MLTSKMICYMGIATVIINLLGNIDVRAGTEAVTFWMHDATERRRLDPTELSGVVIAELNVRNMKGAKSAVVMLDGVEAGDCWAARKGLGGVGFRCEIETSKVEEVQCVGEQLQAMYEDGTYQLSVVAELSDESRVEVVRPMPVGISNADRMIVTVDGANVLSRGVRFYGGATRVDKGISVSLCPVSYDGTQFTELAFESMCINAQAEPPYEIKVDCPPLRFTVPDGEGSAASVRLNDTPYTVEVHSTQNRAVSNGADEGYVIMSAGSVVTEAGSIVTRKFGTGTVAPTGELLRFDFVAPSLSSDAEIRVGEERVVAGRLYSAAQHNKLRVVGVTDGGVGVDDGGVRIDVGDCAVNPLKMNDRPTDRREQAFEPLHRDVTWMGELPEEDAVLDPYLYGDRSDVECYVAVLASLTDRLGNAWDDWETAEDQLQTPEFGVDKTPPVIVNARFGRNGPFNNVADIEIRFGVSDPKLSSGDDGAGVPPGGASIWASGLGRVGSVRVTSRRSATGRVNVLSRDGWWTLAVVVGDAATPPNISEVPLPEVFYDGTAPVLSELSGASGTLTSRDYINVWVSGRAKDAASRLIRTAVTIRVDSNDGICSSSDPVLPRGRVSLTRRIVRDSSETSFGFLDSLRINDPGGLSAEENLCAMFTATDRLLNTADTTAMYLRVHWRRGGQDRADLRVSRRRDKSVGERIKSSGRRRVRRSYAHFSAMLAAVPAGPSRTGIQPLGGRVC